jgi:MFS transporter, MCT family, solute carrier family 16 (monocarboxylic acid transporters), member 3
MTTTATILETRRTQSNDTSIISELNGDHSSMNNDNTPITAPELDDAAPENASTVVPDGGYGWAVVASSSVITFWFSGMTGAWGIIQAALLSSTLRDTPPATTAFIGSLGITICVAFGLVGVHVMRLISARYTALLGITLLGLGALLSGFTTSNVAGLFQTFGVILGVGDCLCFTVANVMPAQYFSRRLGLANGLVKASGGIGATLLSIALNSLIEKVGIEWTFRVLGAGVLLTGIPAALAIKERTSLPNVPIFDFSLLKDIPFAAIFLAGATVTFTLFVPPFFLPLFAKSIGLNSGTGAALVASFNACTAIGRFIAGPACDKFGPLNTFVVAVALNAITTLAIWPVSSALPSLVVFAILNGISNGAFFTTLPTVVVSMVDPSRHAMGMSLSITGWTGGYLMGTPIAGYLLEAAGGEDGGVKAYRPAIFYAGGIATLSSVFVLVARMGRERKVFKRV